jgi:hypothetical protein
VPEEEDQMYETNLSCIIQIAPTDTRGQATRVDRVAEDALRSANRAQDIHFKSNWICESLLNHFLSPPTPRK